MANPKMQEKKNKMLKKKKAVKQKQRQAQKQIVTQTVHVHVNKASKGKSRRGPSNNNGYSAPIVNVSVPTMMRQVPFEVTNSKEYETQLNKAREQQQNDYSRLLNENIPIAEPIREIPQRPTTPQRKPIHTPTQPKIQNPQINEDWLSSFTNQIMDQSLDEVRQEAERKEAKKNDSLMSNYFKGRHTVNDGMNDAVDNIKLISQRKKQEKKIEEQMKAQHKDGMTDALANIKLISQKKKEEKKIEAQMKAQDVSQSGMNDALANIKLISQKSKNEKKYEEMVRKRQRQNEKDAGFGAGIGESQPDVLPTVVNNYMHGEHIQGAANDAIAKAKRLSPEELANECVVKDGKIHTFASSLGIKPTRAGKRRPVEELREEISLKLGRHIFTKKAGRPKKQTDLFRSSESPF